MEARVASCWQSKNLALGTSIKVSQNDAIVVIKMKMTIHGFVEVHVAGVC